GIGQHADALLEPDRARDAEKRRRSERSRDRLRGGESSFGVDGEDRELDAANRVLVRRTRDAASPALRGSRPGAFRVARPDHHVVVAGRGEPGRERAAEAARAAQDGDLHASAPAAPSAAAASSLAAAASVISVLVTTACTPAGSSAGASATSTTSASTSPE